MLLSKLGRFRSFTVIGQEEMAGHLDACQSSLADALVLKQSPEMSYAKVTAASSGSGVDDSGPRGVIPLSLGFGHSLVSLSDSRHQESPPISKNSSPVENSGLQENTHSESDVMKVDTPTQCIHLFALNDDDYDPRLANMVISDKMVRGHSKLPGRRFLLVTPDGKPHCGFCSTSWVADCTTETCGFWSQEAHSCGRRYSEGSEGEVPKIMKELIPGLSAKKKQIKKKKANKSQKAQKTYTQRKVEESVYMNTSKLNEDMDSEKKERRTRMAWGRHPQTSPLRDRSWRWGTRVWVRTMGIVTRWLTDRLPWQWPQLHLGSHAP